MKITDALLGEHGVLYAIFDHLDQLATAGEGSEGDQRLRTLMDLLEAVLVSHAKLEDDELFPVLEQHVGPGGPLAVMREEHREIEGVLAELKGVSDAAVIRDRVRYVLGVARDHFRKEEHVLFQLAEQSLGEAALRRLGTRWAAERGVAIAG
jgi:hemerythrin-like domain-containing protein